MLMMIRMLRDYANPAKRSHNNIGPHGTGDGFAPLALDETAIRLADDAASLTREYAQALGLDSTGTLGDVGASIIVSPRMTASPVTGQYMPLLTRMSVRMENYLNPTDGDTYILGTCPNPDCGRVLRARRGAESVSCPDCHSKWETSFIRKHAEQQVMNPLIVGTPPQCARILAQWDVAVSVNTIRSWARRGKLHQAGENEYSKPIYRVKDVWELAKRNFAHSTDIWNMVGNDDRQKA